MAHLGHIAPAIHRIVALVRHCWALRAHYTPFALMGVAAATVCTLASLDPSNPMPIVISNLCTESKCFHAWFVWIKLDRQFAMTLSPCAIVWPSRELVTCHRSVTHSSVLGRVLPRRQTKVPNCSLPLALTRRQHSILVFSIDVLFLNYATLAKPPLSQVWTLDICIALHKDNTP